LLTDFKIIVFADCSHGANLLYISNGPSWTSAINRTEGDVKLAFLYIFEHDDMRRQRRRSGTRLTTEGNSGTPHRSNCWCLQTQLEFVGVQDQNYFE